MKSSKPKKKMMKRGELARAAVTVTEGELVKTGLLDAERGFPFLVRPAVEGVNLTSWVRGASAWVEEKLLEHGALLFRGFGVDSLEAFQEFFHAACGEPIEYVYRSTPRHPVAGRVYTSTEYPAPESIPMHNEMSYSSTWPMKIGFYCSQPAERGGETPIADSRRVYDGVDPEIRRVFAEKGVMYSRNYGEHLDLPWQNVFQTEDRDEVEAFCRKTGIEFEWFGDDHLRTRQVCPSVAKHPRRGEPVWFNQAHLFHVSALAEELRKALLASFSEEELPRNAFFGDGSPIPVDMLDAVRAVYDRESLAFPWEKGDVLVLDNMLFAHGRRPFEGSRKILVSMAEPRELDR